MSARAKEEPQLIAAVDVELAACRVLVAEDEYFIADDLARALRRHGAEVVGPVGTVKAALACVRTANLDAAIVDINLHGEMAYPAVDALEACGIPMLLTTGYAEADILNRYRHVPRWEKPYEIASLVRHIARLPRLKTSAGGAADHWA